MNTVIQFIHPGLEHTSKTGTIWNSGPHRRKYLKVKGDFLKNLDSNPQNDSLYFWGEWEAQSEAYPINNNEPDFPKTIFSPHYNLPIGNVNTDPFIFGNQFYYSFCRQPNSPLLRNLIAGDIILFGSCINHEFALDTLFVVSNEMRKYKLLDTPRLKKEFSKTFFDVTLSPLKSISCKQDNSCINEKHNLEKICLTPKQTTQYKNDFKIYNGVMYYEKKKYSNIFSYSPCLTGDKGESGFKRPIININKIITPNLSQHFKKTEKQDTLNIWNQITEKVLQEGFSLLINTDLPTIK